MNTHIETVITEVMNSALTKHSSRTRHITSMKVGQHVRQGDIYIHMVDNKHLKGDKLTTTQLAQGDSRGSRHIAESGTCYAGIKSPEWCDKITSRANAVFLGPCVVSDKEFYISHPEHAHVILPAGTYQITHQLDAQTLKRVMD